MAEFECSSAAEYQPVMENKRKKHDLDRDCTEDLPNQMLLQILELLPTPEATLVSLLSKRWRPIPGGLRSLNFDTTCFYPPIAGSGNLASKIQYFRKFVSQTLEKHDPKVDIERFRLSIVEEPQHEHRLEPKEEHLFIIDEVDEWIAKAVSLEVQDFALCLKAYILSGIYYELPSCIFRSEKITTLNLAYCKIISMRAIKLVRLKTLSLNNVFVGKNTMKHLISSCLVLEMLCLKQCRKLGSLEGQNMNLRCLEIESCDTIKVFNLNAPNLLSFKFHSQSRAFELINGFQVHGFGLDIRRLVTLSLKANVTDQMVQLLMSNCHLLENFSLRQCYKLHRLTISSDKLKVLEIDSCVEVKTIEVDTPNLRVFNYVGKEVEISRMNTHTKLVANLKFSREEIQYDRLKSFLEKFNHGKAGSLARSNYARILIPEEILENSFPPLYHIKDLMLIADSRAASYTQVLVGLLRLSVHLEYLTANFESLTVNLKFRPEVPTDLDDDDFLNRSWSDLPIDHLRRRLIGVRIDNMQGDSRERDLVEFICSGEEVRCATFTPSQKTWSWKA